MLGWLKLKQHKVGIIEILLVIALILLDVFKLTYSWISVLIAIAFLIISFIRLFLWRKSYNSRQKTVLYFAIFLFSIGLVYVALHLQPIP